MTFLALLPHGADWIWIAVIFVLLFGAKKLPELARGVGKSLGEFKKAKQEFEEELHASLKEQPKPNIAPPAPVASLPGTVPKSGPSSTDVSQN